MFDSDVIMHLRAFWNVNKFGFDGNMSGFDKNNFVFDAVSAFCHVGLDVAR